jgi:hypothetical protein
MVHVYIRTNITLSQKRLEIQAHRCNGETSALSAEEDITVYYGSNSTAMSAARISTTILASLWACTRVPWYHGSTYYTCTGGTIMVLPGYVRVPLSCDITLWYVPWYVRTTILCHSFLIGKRARVRTRVRAMVLSTEYHGMPYQWYHGTKWYHGTYMCTIGIRVRTMVLLVQYTYYHGRCSWYEYVIVALYQWYSVRVYPTCSQTS